MPFKPLHCVCCCCTIPQRVVLCVLCVLGVVVAYGQRCSMNVAITRMVACESIVVSTSCSVPNTTSTEEQIGGEKKQWTEMDQEILLSSLYVGYLIFHVPGGLLADRFGGRYVFASGQFGASLITACTPFFVNHMPVPGIAVTRAIVGICQAVSYPSMSALVAKWIPFEERAMMGAFSFAANAMGVGIGNVGSGMMMRLTSSWPNVFYFWSALSFMWTGLFLLFVFSQPSTHPYITEKERNFLKEKMPPAKLMKTPWKAIMTDRGIVSLIVTQVGSDYTLYLLITNIPKYMSDVLHVDVQTNAIATSVPFLGMWLGSVISGRIIDYGLKTRQWNLKWVRRLGTVFSMMSPASFALLIPYLGCEYLYVMIAFTIAVFTKGPHYATFKVNHMDISVNFNGIIMALINGFGSLGGIIPPYVVAFVAKDNTLEQWQIVFWITWLVSLASSVMYGTTAQVNRAEWDVPPEEHGEWLLTEVARKAEELRKKEEKEMRKEERKREKERKKTERRDI